MTPAAPAGLVATAAAPTRVDLTWTDSDANETGFRIERRLRPDALPTGAVGPVFSPANGNHYAFVPGAIDVFFAPRAAHGLVLYGKTGHLATITSQAENDLVRSLGTQAGWIEGSDFPTEGTFAWRGGPESGLTFWSGGAVGQTGYANWAPGEPSASNSGHDFVELLVTGTWNDAPRLGTNAQGYFVEFETNGAPGSTFASVGTVGSGVTAFSDTTAAGSTGYEYRVVAVNGALGSVPSGVATATTSAQPAPSAPSGLLVVSAVPAGVDLSWTDGSSDETGFRVERRRFHGALPAGALPVRLGTTGNHYARIGAFMTQAAAKTAAEGLTLLGRPGHLPAITSRAENDLLFPLMDDNTWIGATDAAVEGTWRWTGGPEDGQSFWVGGAAGQTPFVFWHEDEPNNSGNEDCGFMGFPHGVWADVDTTHTAPYFVEFETAGITDDAFAAVGTVGPNVIGYTDTTVAASQRWEYRVVAVGALASSAPSNVVAATIP